MDPETTEDMNDRITLRNQLYQGGLDKVFEKMKSMNNNLLERKVKEFNEAEERDNATVYDGLVLGTKDPAEILDKITTAIDGTRAYHSFQSILQQLLLMQQDPEKR